MSGSTPVSSDVTILALFNHKGGVSKTTTAYNLGWALASAGRRVLMVDADPQCNLTGMTLSLAGEADFAAFYEGSPRQNLYGALRPAFESMPEPIKPVEGFEVPNRPGLYLLPGHVSVAEYDVPLGVAYELTGSLGVMKNLPGAISFLLRSTAAKLAIDYAIVDMSPSISSLNQNLFMSSTHFIVPCSPDFFCAMAIDTLTRVLPRWANWPRRAKGSGLFDGAAYPVPPGLPAFLGTINQQYRPRYGRPAKSFQMWIDRIADRVQNQLVPALQREGMMLNGDVYATGSISDEPYNLANISDFNSLIAKSQDENVPVYELSDAQLSGGGTVLENMKASREKFDKLFRLLAKAIESMTS